VAEQLGMPFVEIDKLVERAAGMSLAEVFELHGEGYYRKLEREALKRMLEGDESAVVATGGSVVSDGESFELLKRGATTVWLNARPEDHMARVVAQGDERPMRDRRDAMSELRTLFVNRASLYAQADFVVDTSALGVEGTVATLTQALSERGGVTT
jgi:XRE family aerobic/anaerobic benzoate catabolism transcriptional regulator